MTTPWIPIRYREFYDIPRAIVITWSGETYFLDCPFDDSLDDYPNSFTVYRLPESLAMCIDSCSWNNLARQGVPVGVVEAEEIDFDSTRRRMMRFRSFSPAE